jgi:hypothetical protein
MFIPDPEHWSGYLAAVFQNGTGMINVVTIMSFITKRTPKMVRGIIMNLFGAIGSFGCIVYLQLVRQTVPNIFGYSMCFGYVVVLDVISLILVMILIWCNKFGNTAPAEDEALGNVAKSNDVVTSDSSND